MLGNVAQSLEVGDLPVVPTDLRSTYQYTRMRKAMQDLRLRIFNWKTKPGSGWNLGWQVVHTNAWILIKLIFFAASSAILFYVPYFFLRRVIIYLEQDPGRDNIHWGMYYAIGLFVTSTIGSLRAFHASLSIAPDWLLNTMFLSVTGQVSASQPALVVHR